MERVAHVTRGVATGEGVAVEVRCVRTDCRLRARVRLK